jgi:hypothetical protein
MKLQDQVLSGEEIYLKDTEVNILGPRLTLNKCKIISEASAKALALTDVSIVDSIVDAKKTLFDFQWCKANLNGVKFIGHFSGCDFGNWEEFHGKYGGIENCDFSEANLDNCRFMNCDPYSIVFPKWPCFTIMNPRARAEEIKSVSWPGKLGLIMGIFADSPEGCVAVSGNAQVLLKKLGGTEQEFKVALSQLDGVFF